MLPAYPKMIVFDYGHTLLYEPGFNALNASKAIFQYIAENPRGLTPEEVTDFSAKLSSELGNARQAGFETDMRRFQRFMTEYLGIRYSVSIQEAETILFDGMSEGAVMPGAAEMLDFINARGIRSAVISNIGWSGSTLTERLNRLLPRNRFEFVIASSDYILRKPNRLLFELALRKAGLAPKDVWYCGDSPEADVMGAAQAGIFPVWYDNPTEKPAGRLRETAPKCGHLHIEEWAEMTELLERLEKQGKAERYSETT